MSERPSRFAGLRDSVLGDAAEGTAPTPSPSGRAGRGGARAGGRRPGRPRGKRSDPAYVQLTSYVREENLDDAKQALMQEKRDTGRKRDISDVIDSLLAFYAQEGDPWKELRDGRG